MRSVLGKVGLFCCLIFLLEEEGLSPAPALVSRWVLAGYYYCSWFCYGVCNKVITGLFLLGSVLLLYSEEIQVVGMPPKSPLSRLRSISAQGLGLEGPRKLRIFSYQQSAEMQCEMYHSWNFESIVLGEEMIAEQSIPLSSLYLLLSVGGSEISINCTLKIIKVSLSWDKIISNFDKVPRQRSFYAPLCKFSQSKH